MLNSLPVLLFRKTLPKQRKLEIWQRLELHFDVPFTSSLERLLKLARTKYSERLLGFLKATIGNSLIASLHLIDECKTGCNSLSKAPILGSPEWNVTVKGILLLSFFGFSLKASFLGIRLALSTCCLKKFLPFGKKEPTYPGGTLLYQLYR